MSIHDCINQVNRLIDPKLSLEICNCEGVRIGVGRAGCNAKELRHQIKEHKLTNKGGKGILSKPVIHRNHLFLE